MTLFTVFSRCFRCKFWICRLCYKTKIHGLDRFHGNGPYCKILTEKEPITAQRFALDWICHIIKRFTEILPTKWFKFSSVCPWSAVVFFHLLELHVNPETNYQCKSCLFVPRTFFSLLFSFLCPYKLCTLVQEIAWWGYCKRLEYPQQAQILNRCSCFEVIHS